MIRLILWLAILIQMTDNSALACELNRTPWHRINWLHLIGLMIILISVIRIAFNINFDGIKGKANLKRPFPAKKEESRI